MIPFRLLSLPFPPLPLLVLLFSSNWQTKGFITMCTFYVLYTANLKTSPPGRPEVYEILKLFCCFFCVCCVNRSWKVISYSSLSALKRLWRSDYSNVVKQASVPMITLKRLRSDLKRSWKRRYLSLIITKNLTKSKG